MATKLTFKEYIESKTKLLEAVSNTPKQTSTYTVKKYCKLVVGESKQDKEYVNLKPNQQIVVEWEYEDVDCPSIVGIMFECVDDVDPSNTYDCYWGGERLQKWLDRNTKKQ